MIVHKFETGILKIELAPDQIAYKRSNYEDYRIDRNTERRNFTKSLISSVADSNGCGRLVFGA
jgi:hypothetical protein